MNVIHKLVRNGKFSFELNGQGKCQDVEVIMKKIIILPNLRRGCLKKISAAEIQDETKDIFMGNIIDMVNLEIGVKRYRLLQLTVGKIVDSKKHIFVLENDHIMYTGKEIQRTANCSNDD